LVKKVHAVFQGVSREGGVESTGEKVGVENSRLKLLDDQAVQKTKGQASSLCSCLPEAWQELLGNRHRRRKIATAFKQDLAWICYDTDRCKSMEFQGISGQDSVMTPKGEGPGLRHVKAYSGVQAWLVVWTTAVFESSTTTRTWYLKLRRELFALANWREMDCPW
jgi:hypothetical protein